MKKKQNDVGRRAFLKGSVRTLVAAPLVMAATPAPEPDEGTVLEEGAQPLPGDPGYRDPDAYGSLAD